jgi:hypothetical protein
LITSSIERWDTRESYISNDTARPNITLCAIVLGEDLRSNIIRSTKLLVKLFILIKNKGSSKIDNLDLIEFFVLF